MSKASDDALRHHAARRVEAFHDAFEVKAGTLTTAIERRHVLHEEEHRELVDALLAMHAALGDPARFERTFHEAVARELADVMVVAYGTADLLDIDLDAAFDAVMDANMAKLPACWRCDGGSLIASQAPCPECEGTGKGKPIKRSDGKVMKPPSWQPPDLSAALA